MKHFIRVFLLLIIIGLVPTMAPAQKHVITRPTTTKPKPSPKPRPKPGSPSGTTMSAAERKRVLQEIVNNMVAVQGGTFTMGATPEQGVEISRWEKPVHEVTVSDFSISKYEVTQRQWRAVMGSNPSLHKGDNLPVEQVTWEECQEFIRKLNQLTGRWFRLPTEAEWEFAARGGNRSRGYKFAGSNSIDNVAWYNGNCRDSQPVGRKQPNELGLYDMSGNVREWCQDWWGAYSSDAQTNPSGPSDGDQRINRGGDNEELARDMHISQRFCERPTRASFLVGLRLAM